jgi:hypothetical protein
MLSDVGTQLWSKTLLEKGGRSPPSIPHAQNINYYDILHMVPCGPLCRALICTHKSLTLHSAMLSRVLIPTVPYSPLHITVPCGPLCRTFIYTYGWQSTYVTHRLRDL